MQLGHLVKRSLTCGLRTNEYLAGNPPMRSRLDFGPSLGIVPNVAPFIQARSCSRCGKIVFVEVDQTGNVLYDLRGQLLFPKHSGSHRGCDGRFEMRCDVSLPDLPRRVLMESVHEIVEFERVDIAMFPTIELDAKLTQGSAQFAIMRDPRPFSN